MNLEELVPEIFRLKIPFENLETAVFFVRDGDRLAIIDSATCASDVDRYLLPAARQLGGRVTHVMLTHQHADHAGGVKRLLTCCPEATVYAIMPMPCARSALLHPNDRLFGRMQTIALPGHTQDSVGFWDLQTRTLFSGDCLQLAGIGRYVHGVSDLTAYLQSVARLKTMRPARIVASHEYVPLGSIAEGEEAVTAYLDACQRLAVSSCSQPTLQK